MRWLLLLLSFVLGACGPQSARESSDPLGAAGAPTDPPPATAALKVAVIYAGQSNCASLAHGDPPTGIPSAAVPYWATLINTTVQGDSLGPLAPVAGGSWGAELSLGLALQEDGVAVLKVARNASFVRQWTKENKPSYSAIFRGQIEGFKRALGDEERDWHFVWDQGEAEAMADNDSSALGWGESYRSLVASVESACACQVTRHVVVTNEAIGGYVSIVREQQVATGAYLVDADYLETSDGVHRTGPSQNTVGERMAASISGSHGN